MIQNFTYYNPTKIVFGKDTISQLSDLISKEEKVFLVYGGGSIKRNGVYEQVMRALDKYKIVEFSGIEPNPQYSTLMKAVELGKSEKITFILGVGGGSVIDGIKFISAAMEFEGKDPWDILAKHVPLTKAIPLGCVLTLPAAGSEMISNSVVSRADTKEKLFFSSPLVYPKFAILDPQTTFSLPAEQTRNGIVDAFVHVTEQYLTYPVNAPLQDRQAEAILLTLIEEGPKVIRRPDDYEARANVMWCATQALNGLIGCGVPQDWTTHVIGHELTALYGLAHGQTLAIVHPALLKHQQESKSDKLCQYARRVWNIEQENEKELREKAIAKTEEFFQSLGMQTKLKDYGIGDENFEFIASRLVKRRAKWGEREKIGKKEILQILRLCL